MEDTELCRRLHKVAYNSCVDSYFVNGDRNDIYEYWLYLIELKRSCEAMGVQKALELIEIYENLDG